MACAHAPTHSARTLTSPLALPLHHPLSFSSRHLTILLSLSRLFTSVSPLSHPPLHISSRLSELSFLPLCLSPRFSTFHFSPHCLFHLPHASRSSPTTTSTALKPVVMDECAEKTDERVKYYENTNKTKENNTTTCAERKVAADRECAQGVSRCDLEGRVYLHYQEQEAVKDGKVVVGLGLKKRRGVPPLLWHQHVRDRHKDTHK